MSGVYASACHAKERTILEDQMFPRCAVCDQPTSWVFKRTARSIAKGAGGSKR